MNFWSKTKPANDHINRGSWAETEANDFLCKKGMKLRQRNYRSRYGEIDLIMNDQNGALVFVEVRYRNNQRFGGALASINAAKQDRIRACAQHYLQQHPKFEKLPCRFDAIAITHSGEDVKLDWVKNAF